MCIHKCEIPEWICIWPGCFERGIVLIAHQVIYYHASAEEMQHKSGMTHSLDIFQYGVKHSDIRLVNISKILDGRIMIAQNIYARNIRE